MVCTGRPGLTVFTAQRTAHNAQRTPSNMPWILAFEQDVRPPVGRDLSSTVSQLHVPHVTNCPRPRNPRLARPQDNTVGAAMARYPQTLRDAPKPRVAPVSRSHLQGIHKLVRVVPRENNGAFRRHVALADDINLEQAIRWRVGTVLILQY